MKKMGVWAVLVSALAVTGVADDELLKNGDFEKGESGWDARKGVSVIAVTNATSGVTEINHVLQVEQHKKRQTFLEQDFRHDKKARSLDISYRIRTTEGTEGETPSGDYNVKLERDNGWTSTTRPLPAPGAWAEPSWNFSHMSDTRKLNLIFEFPPGKGRIWLDDVSIKEAK